MKLCNFKHTSTNNIISGDWTPFSPKYYPFADVDEFCMPCYRWRYLELIRGNFPRWGWLLKNPRNPTDEFPQYYNVSRNYRSFSVSLMRALSRSSHPDSIIRNIPNPGLLLDYLSAGQETEEHHHFAIDLVSQWLDRLNTVGDLEKYHSSSSTLFNLHILNENFDVYRQDPNPINLTQLNNSSIGTSRPRTPETFSWRGGISIFGTIPIIHLEEQEIRVPIPIADNFFDFPIDLSNNSSPTGIREMFVTKEFHKMWILRESLAQLIEDQLIQAELYDGLEERIFLSNFDLNAYNFRDFTIIIDTIDHSLTLDNIDFRTETGQAAIIYDLLYQPYPNIVNTFQGFDPCPIKTGEDPANRYNCPLRGNMGCGMSDRRVADLRFPRDRIERNIHKFLRLLRDEAVFGHSALYKVTRLNPLRLDELNQYSDFWIGNVYQDTAQRWVFEPTMPIHWQLPQPSDKIYELSLISPICYEGSQKVRFDSRLASNNYQIAPITTMNPWIEEAPFNIGHPISCIIGRLSIDDFSFNINRQKRQLVKSIHYLSSSLTQVSSVDRPNEILARRLDNNERRIGMATFGRFARFV